MKTLRVGGMTLHAHAVAEYCAAREWTARIDADHAYLAFAAPELADERIDECRLPAPGGPVIPTRCARPVCAKSS
jgi:hypothetical protein